VAVNANQSHTVRTGSIPGTGIPFALSEYRRRLDAAIAKFDSFAIDAVVATSPTSLRYLTGYDGTGAYFAPFPVIVTPTGEPTYVARILDEDAIRAEGWIDDILTYTHEGEFAPAWAEALRSHNLGGARLGLELGSWNLSPADVSALQSRLPELRIVDATRLIPSVAAIKSPDEIDVMRAAMALTDIAIEKFYDFIRPGATELEAAEAIDHAITEAGGLTRLVSLLFGTRTALPHGKPSTYQLDRNQPAIIEVGGVKSGYAGGLMRSAVLGRHVQAEALHEVAEDALAAGIAAIRPGVQLGDVDAAARRVVADAGKSATFAHRLGYQIGIGWLERGYLSIEPGAKDVVETGMTFHLPVILFEGGQFSTGVSQTVVVTESGAEPLSSTSPALYHGE
jgi:Xaa-Pro dipeptidase